jgi:IS5 family transposase
MARQISFATAGFELYAKTTKRAAFLAEMEAIVPWALLCALIEPVYPKPGNGRPLLPLERMLRVHFLQHWFNLSDPAMEDALYESPALRAFAGIDLGVQARAFLQQRPHMRLVARNQMRRDVASAAMECKGPDHGRGYSADGAPASSRLWSAVYSSWSARLPPRPRADRLAGQSRRCAPFAGWKPALRLR